MSMHPSQYRRPDRDRYSGVCWPRVLFVGIVVVGAAVWVVRFFG